MLLHQVLHFLIAYGSSGSLTRHAPQADTRDAAAPQCLHLCSLEFQKCSVARAAGGVCVLSCVLYSQAQSRSVNYTSRKFWFSGLLLPSQLGHVPVV